MGQSEIMQFLKGRDWTLRKDIIQNLNSRPANTGLAISKLLREKAIIKKIIKRDYGNDNMAYKINPDY